MKKIRFLAALLVLLMLPFSVLIGCNDDKDPEDDDPKDPVEDPGTTTPGGNDTDISDTVPDNDGLSGDGYLVMFNFNVAKRGDFPTVAPYSRYIKPTTSAMKNTIYVIDDKGGKNGSGALLIQRTDNSSSQASVVFSASAISAFGTQHTLEFDVKIGGGLLGDTLNVFAGATSGKKLLSITPEGKIADCEGTPVYTVENSKVSEWVHVALAVDDRACTYDVYVNGVKKTSETTFETASSDVEQYTFALAGSTRADTYCYLDNLAFVDGISPKEYTKDDVIYKDRYTATNDLFTASKTDDNGNILPNLDSLLKLYNKSGMTNKVNKDPYQSSSSALSMKNTLTLIKIDANGEFVDTVYDDYGVLTGLYRYGAPVGGKLYKSGEGDDAKYIDFNADKNYTFTAENLGGDTIGKMTGTYAVSGSEESTLVELTYGNNLQNKLYLVIDKDDKLTVYADAKYSVTTASGFTCVSAPFNKVEYSYKSDDADIAVLADFYTKKASLYVALNGSVAYEASSVDFTYDAETNELTIGEYKFTYVPAVEATEDTDAVPAKFTFAVDADTTVDLTETKTEEYISAEEAEAGYEYALRFQNFQSGVSSLTFAVDDLANFNTSVWKTLSFDYYVSQEMYDARFQFMFYVSLTDNGGSPRYCSKTFTCGTGDIRSAGWYNFTAEVTSLSNGGSGGKGDYSQDFTGNVILTTTGWSNGPASSTNSNQAYNGYAIYVKNVQFVTEVAVEVKGPDMPAEGEDACNHIDDETDASLFVPVANMVEPTCSAGGYYLLECSKCHAQQIDDSKPVTAPGGHDFEGADVLTVEATCNESGYTYHYCNDCKEAVKIADIPATGHNVVTKYIASTKTMISTCRVCGNEDKMKLSDTLMDMTTKIASNNLATNEYFYIAAGVNDSHTVGSYDVEAKQQASGAINIMAKYSVASAVKLADGTYALKFQRKQGSSSDSYLDYSLSKRYGEGGHFVLEFDMMLGGADSNGKYEPMTFNLIERVTTSGPTSINIFTISDAGVLKFKQDSTATITLSPDKFTNIAMAFKATENLVDVYVDGYKTYTIPMDDATKADYLATTPWSEARLTFNGKHVVTGDQYHYFNNFATYEGDSPLCVLGFGDASASITEFEGTDIILEDETGNAATYPINVTADKVLKLPTGVNTSKYVLEFKLSADAALADGDLLIGTKEDKYKYDNDLALLTVKGGWLYFGDIAIADLANVTEGVTIKMAFDENEGGVNIYVNGTEIAGGFVYYPAAENQGDMFADADSRIRSYKFASSVGAYTISDLAMYANK